MYFPNNAQHSPTAQRCSDIPNNGPREGIQGLKYDLFRTKPLFVGNLERFGEIWILIWIKCQRLQPLL